MNTEFWAFPSRCLQAVPNTGPQIYWLWGIENHLAEKAEAEGATGKVLTIAQETFIK